MSTAATPAKDAVRIMDTTLRDGSHAVAHRFTEEQVARIARALDDAGVAVIEVTHSDGLAGSSFNYGFSAVRDIRLIEVAASVVTRASVAALLLPGLGTVRDLREAVAAGARYPRVATHSTEVDVSVQHFVAARELGLETAGFLMLSHRTEPAELARQARIMAAAGCQCVSVVDSAGARRSKGTLRALGAGAGNTPTEVLVAALDALGIPTGVQLPAILEAAEVGLGGVIPTIPKMDRDAIVQGRYGGYNSFLLHAHRASERYGVPRTRSSARSARPATSGGRRT